MRAAFLAAVLVLAAGYTWLAFAELSWLSSTGRLGPGFFPRIIGVALVLLCAYSLFREIKNQKEELSSYWPTALAIAALSAGFVAILEPLGGLLAMIVFLGASLAALNRGRPLQNAAIALLLPICMYLLFKVWLNAALPRGLLAL